jgi:hypothetical protein
MLADQPLTSTIPVTGINGARAWYADKLDLTPDGELPGQALAYRIGSGVQFEEYDQPGLRTIDGIAVTPVGRAVWFKDCEGKTLTISQLG